MRTFWRAATVGAAAILSIVTVLSSTGYLQLVAAAASFLETFDGAPAQPADYTNPHNWDIFVQGFNDQEVGSSVAQHGPNCDPPGFPYNGGNTHPLHSAADAVFICNNHMMTSPGITGYGAIYMTPPAMLDLSQGTAVVRWDMSTLRTSARDWVDVVLNPYNEHQIMAYNNGGFHAPPDNVHIELQGVNGFRVSERVNGGSDVYLPSNGSFTWDDVQQANGVSEDAARRDTFEIDLSTTHVRICIMGNNTGQTYTFQGHPGFCWVDADLPTPLSSSVWGNQAQVEFNHRVYNAEKACSDQEDQFNIVHNPTGDANCPPNTWHWDNVNINPAIPFGVIKAAQNYQVTNTSPQTVTFQQPAPANTNLEFVTFGTNSALQVSYDGGRSWHHPFFQPATASGHDENGEVIWDPVPTGIQSIMVQGQNGFWGTYESVGFTLVSRTGSAGSPPPTNTPQPQATATPTQPSAGGSSITVVPFDDLQSPNRVLSGQYPNNVFDWGNGGWWLSGPYSGDSSNSVSFNGSGPTSASINVLSPVRLLQVDAINGGATASTVTITCAGQPNATASVPAGQQFTIQTHWTASCPSISFSSSNGWNTNFDNLVIEGGASSSGSPTATPTARPTNTPVPQATSTPTARPTNTPTPTSGGGGQTTVTFNDLSSPNRPLNGQYPANVIDWGTNNWYLSGPDRQFTTNSVSFNGAGPTSETFSFVSPHRLIQMDVQNDGSQSSTVTLSCSGQPTRTFTLAPGQAGTIQTGWTGPCSSVTITSSNGWSVNFDNLVIQ